MLSGNVGVEEVSISLCAAITSALFCLIGIYWVFFPDDFKKRIAKSSNKWVRYLGVLSICAGVLLLGFDIRAQAILKFMRSVEKVYQVSDDSEPNRLDSLSESSSNSSK